LNFGEVGVGEQARQTVSVGNAGEEALTLTGLQFSGAGAPFVLAALEGDVVAPGQSVSFEVVFSPTTSESFQEEVILNSDDPTSPSMVISLTGTGLGGSLDLSTESLDGGNVYLGCTRAMPLDVGNPGNAPLVVSSIHYVSGGEEFSVDLQEFMNAPLPWTLAPQEVVPVLALYHPTEAGADIGVLQVDSDDFLHPHQQIRYSVVGTVYASVEDSFVCTDQTDRELFPLSAWPVPDRIWVEVDGSALTEGWYYRLGDNNIQFFEPFLPQVGSTVVITYDQQGDCWE
jgi:hypothetical protein